jgi:NAD(P)-dependent dehydrogenase (short-subunit alcohol dehydrogenase family)
VDDRELEGLVAVVTGGGRGVGRAIADQLATEGAAVALVARSQTELDEAARLATDRGARAIAVRADVTESGAVDEMVERVERELGPIDLLVNAAGTCAAIGPLWQVDPHAWLGDIEANLTGTFLCARAVLPGMIGRGGGRIVNVSSYAAVRPAPHISAYGAAKAAVLHLTNSLAAEVAGHGVTVFAVTPGTVRTAMTERMTESAAGREWLPEIPPERWLDVGRVGELVGYLASGRADRLSGRFLHVLDDVDDLVSRATEVERDDLYVLRLRT